MDVTGISVLGVYSSSAESSKSDDRDLLLFQFQTRFLLCNEAIMNMEGRCNDFSTEHFL